MFSVQFIVRILLLTVRSLSVFTKLNQNFYLFSVNGQSEFLCFQYKDDCQNFYLLRFSTFDCQYSVCFFRTFNCQNSVCFFRTFHCQKLSVFSTVNGLSFISFQHSLLSKFHLLSL